MKKLIFFLLLSTTTFFVSAKDIVIDNPAYEVKNSGITNISRIELKENETRIYVHCTFVPHWWIKFTKQFIKLDNNGERLYATAIEGGEFEQEIFMPDSGDSTFVVVFPKVDRSVTKIDYGNDGNLIVYGISPDANKKNMQQPKGVPAEVKNWIDKQLAKAPRKTLMNPE